MTEENKKGGLYHSFFLLESDKYLPSRKRETIIDFDEIFENNKCVNIQDDHLRYMNDTLLWIPTYNYWKKEISHGLNLHGETVIQKNGAFVAHKVFTNWSNLFRCGTRTFEITGNYTFIVDNPEQGFYEMLNINRDEFVETLETLAFYCEEVIKSDDQKFIWHFGI